MRGHPHRKHRRPSAPGFTLIEVMIAVGVVGLLSAVVVPSAQRYRITVNETGAQTGLDAFRKGMLMYYILNSRYPSSLLEMGAASPPFVDVSLAGGQKQGYTYTLEEQTDHSYTIWASPTQPAVTGVRWFELTEGGAITEIASAYDSSIAAAQVVRRNGRWFTDGKEMWSAWSSWRESLEYKVDFGKEGGFFDVGLTARNHDFWPQTNEGKGIPASRDPNYRFAVDVYVDGVKRGTVQVGANNASYHRSSINAFVSSGEHEVRFRWTNDNYDRNKHTGEVYADANIRIKDVFFKRTGN